MVWQILQPCINLGLEEEKFWSMTVAEAERWVKGAMWRMKTQAQFDYILSDLIGISVARVMSSDVKLPAIEDAYPNLFDKKIVEAKEDKSMQSVNNFMARAMAINKAKRQAKKENGGEHKT